MEQLHERLSLLRLRSAIQPQVVQVPAHLQEVLQDIMTLVVRKKVGRHNLGQDPVKELNLARYADEIIVDGAGGVDLVFNTLKEEGVLADLTELHELVAETLDTSRFAVERGFSDHSGETN